MYQKIDNCPLCGSKDIKNFIICQDHFVSGESFAINECNSCTFRFTNPRPLNTELEKYYQSENYISHTNKANSLTNFLYKLVRNFTLKNKLKLINSLSEKGKILDVGCGTGEFLYVCNQNGWNIYGVEKDPLAMKNAEKLLNIKIYEHLSDLYPEGEFEIITFWHVLEHMPDLHEVISQVKKLLLKKGSLVLALPNHESYDAEKYKEYWAAYDVPRHLYHFNQSSLKSLAKLHDLKLKSIIPMKMDAFYVSLLSEYNKYKRKNYIKSAITGLKSNSYGAKNNNNYSSLIYLLKK